MIPPLRKHRELVLALLCAPLVFIPWVTLSVSLLSEHEIKHTQGKIERYHRTMFVLAHNDAIGGEVVTQR